MRNDNTLTTRASKRVNASRLRLERIEKWLNHAEPALPGVPITFPRSDTQRFEIVRCLIEVSRENDGVATLDQLANLLPDLTRQEVSSKLSIIAIRLKLKHKTKLIEHTKRQHYKVSPRLIEAFDRRPKGKSKRRRSRPIKPEHLSEATDALHRAFKEANQLSEDLERALALLGGKWELWLPSKGTIRYELLAHTIEIAKANNGVTGFVQIAERMPHLGMDRIAAHVSGIRKRWRQDKTDPLEWVKYCHYRPTPELIEAFERAERPESEDLDPDTIDTTPDEEAHP